MTSCIISSAAYFYVRSLEFALVSCAVGIFIDLDHFVDYFLNHKFSLKLKEIYRACDSLDLKKLYVVLHSYELAALLWLAIYLLSLPLMWSAVALGMTQHLIFDQITNPITARGYFLLYRIFKRFNTADLVVHERAL